MIVLDNIIYYYILNEEDHSKGENKSGNISAGLGRSLLPLGEDSTGASNRKKSEQGACIWMDFLPSGYSSLGYPSFDSP